MNTPELTSEDRDRIVAAARSFIGAPFRFGGAVPGAIDCVGLLCLVGDRTGMHFPKSIPYTVSDARRPGIEDIAAEHLRKKPLEEMEPGDVLLFWLVRPELAQHFGVYTGAGRFVHAYQRPPKCVTECAYQGIWQRRALQAYEFRKWPSSET